MENKSIITDILFSSLSGMTAKLFEHPFDTVKVRLQTSNQYLNSVDCFLKTLKNENLLAFYKGLSIPLFGTIFEMSVSFTSYNYFQKKLKSYYNLKHSDQLSIKLLSLSVEFVKCNLQVQTHSSNLLSPLQLINDTVKNNGFVGLNGTLLRVSIGSAAWFGSYEIVCKYLSKNKTSKNDLNSLELMTAGAVAGMTYNAAFFPADVIKSRLQTQNSKSFIKVAKSIYSESGCKGFFRGFSITVLRSAPSSALIFSIYELLNRNLSL
ncbi:hypothetical protein HK099_006775 [Clydaea vesicula]|uniref:Mitochondrial carrier protein n=1 Tax=Clydaea vesicula TaxID=447962 RepID=A0AAD5TZV9_9FUNG|nr:hypothetical protein HK099_006775 [Clydaea vesicula]